MDEDPTHSQLDVTVLGDVSREVTYTSGSGNDNRKRNVTMWTKKRSLAVHVHVEETLTGLVRVIKKVKPHSPQVRDWRPEIQLMGRVSDETSLFIQLYGWFWSEDFVCIAMEYCPLGDLAACFSEPLSEVVTWGICSQLLQGLARLHEMAITHRDIKPQNILVVTKDPLWVKIADFGISKQALDGETDLRTPRAGTEGFMAPEILGLTSNARKESRYTSAVDIWSLGCLLHYALTKESPFPKYQTLADHCRGLVPYPEAALTRRGIGLSGRLFIKELLVLEPANRPAASVDLMSKWTVTEMADIPDLDRAGSVRSVEDMGGMSTDGWSNDVAAAHTLFSGNEPSTDEPSTANINPVDDVMDYHTSELWHILQDTGHGPERIRPLLEQGANPNKLHKGYTALHLATTSGSISRMEVLLEYGAQGSVRTQPHGETALHLATFNFDLDKMKLLTTTTDINAQNAGGDTALHLVIARGHALEALKSLLGHRASANIPGRLGRTPLVYALYLCQQRVAEVLLEAGADPNVADSQGRAALHYAAASDRFSCAFIHDLIKGGADVNQVDNNLKTPLHEAVETGKGDVIRALVDAGADTKLGDPSFERRLQRALFWGGISEKLPWPLRNNIK